MMPLVTVVITTFNRASLLRRAIKSVFEQNYENIEIIVVDDNSSDETSDIICDLKNELTKNISNFIYHRNDMNMGANYGRNVGLKLSTGTYITGLDDDDYFKPTRIYDLFNGFNSKYSFICDSYLIDNGHKIHRRFSRGADILLPELLKENVAGNQIFTLKERLVAIGGYDGQFKRLQDQDVWTRLVIRYGSGIRLNNNSYVMDISHDAPRITTSVKDYQAYRRYYYKFKNNMTEDIRRYNMTRLLYLRYNNPIHVCRLMGLHFNMQLLCKYVIKSYFPFSKNVKKHIDSFRLR